MRKWLVVLILLVGSLSAFAVEGKDESRENRKLVYKVDIMTRSVLVYGGW